MRICLIVSAVLVAAPALPAQQPPKVTVPAGVVFERDVEYANPDGQHLQLNLARPKDGAGPFPAVICIHGGGFRAGSREGGCPQQRSIPRGIGIHLRAVFLCQLTLVKVGKAIAVFGKRGSLPLAPAVIQVE